jgi:hypothetical protein
MAIPSSTFTEIVTTTLNRYSPQLADNVTDHHPLLQRLKSKGNAKPVAGGVAILENLMYGENSTFGWYNGVEILDVSQSDVLTSATFAWKQANCNVVISGLEQMQNSGSKETVHNLLESRIKVAEKTMANQIGAALFYNNTESSGKAIGGLQHLVADLPTSGIVGGIDRSSNTWWQNQYYDFGDNSATGSSTTIKGALNQVYIATTRGRDMVDFIVMDNNYFNFYLESLQDQQRFMAMETASAGFSSLKYWGGKADVFFDAGAPENHAYGLNTDYVHFRPHSDRNFVTLDRKASVNQDAIVVPLFWAGNMTLSNASLQFVVLE